MQCSSNLIKLVKFSIYKLVKSNYVFYIKYFGVYCSADETLKMNKILFNISFPGEIL